MYKHQDFRPMVQRNHFYMSWEIHSKPTGSILFESPQDYYSDQTFSSSRLNKWPIVLQSLFLGVKPKMVTVGMSKKELAGNRRIGTWFVNDLAKTQNFPSLMTCLVFVQWFLIIKKTQLSLLFLQRCHACRSTILLVMANHTYLSTNSPKTDNRISRVMQDSLTSWPANLKIASDRCFKNL